jgi:hypothetical protein
MTTQARPSPAPAVLVAVLEPVGVEGCGVCGALADQRETARGAGELSKVRSCNAELANHPHVPGGEE